ncbi:MAG TPA: late competence development ComFB family protein [Desulfitobacteriaceae bacterium]|nr:late competence development ComFB family protein [Desulfitobacteriaceae bacterium]
MYELKNHTRTVVREILQEYISTTGIPCSCELCQADIMAFALNRLPAKYAVSLRGHIMTHWQSQAVQDRTRILSEIIRAAQKVASSPSHTI